MVKQITDYLLYRWRHRLGYVVIGLAVLGLLVVAGFLTPGGLSQQEIESVVASDSLSFSLQALTPDTVINLPYHLLQRLSLGVFGVSHFSIKLPSLILGLLSALGMMILLRMWFRHNVAVISAVLVITTGQFLFIAQSGTPSIVYIFGSVWLLVAAMMVSRRLSKTTMWKVILFSIAALSLYTPLSFYVLAALLSAVILHPHLRFIVKQLSKVKLLVAALFALIILAPLVYILVRSPATALVLLGIPSAMPDIPANALQVLRQYLDFTMPGSGVLMTPIYGLGSMLLIVLGMLHLFTTKYTARSYIITAWSVLLLPVLVINPSVTAVTFVPILLLMAMGISTLLSNWYTLFPRNPYARVAGLIPLAILIGGMVFSGVDRYVYGYLHDPRTASYFSRDLSLLNSQLQDKQRGKTTLVVASTELPFYNVVAKHHPLTTTSAIGQPVVASDTTILTQTARAGQPIGDPYRIITSDTSQGADRFYIYKTKKE